MSPDERESRPITDDMRQEWDLRQREMNQRDAERKAWVPTWYANTYTYGVTATWVESGQRWATTLEVPFTRHVLDFRAGFSNTMNLVTEELRRRVEHQIRTERPTPVDPATIRMERFLVDDRTSERIRIPLS